MGKKEKILLMTLIGFFFAIRASLRTSVCESC